MTFNFKFLANLSLSVKTRPKQMVFVLQLNNSYCDVTKEENGRAKFSQSDFVFSSREESERCGLK